MMCAHHFFTSIAIDNVKLWRRSDIIKIVIKFQFSKENILLNDENLFPISRMWQSERFKDNFLANGRTQTYVEWRTLCSKQLK